MIRKTFFGMNLILIKIFLNILSLKYQIFYKFLDILCYTYLYGKVS